MSSGIFMPIFVGLPRLFLHAFYIIAEGGMDK